VLLQQVLQYYRSARVICASVAALVRLSPRVVSNITGIRCEQSSVRQLQDCTMQADTGSLRVHRNALEMFTICAC
jgi:hypothetical protein